jgi:hypothetical protein
MAAALRADAAADGERQGRRAEGVGGAPSPRASPRRSTCNAQLAAAGVLVLTAGRLAAELARLTGELAAIAAEASEVACELAAPRGASASRASTTSPRRSRERLSPAARRSRCSCPTAPLDLVADIAAPDGALVRPGQRGWVRRLPAAVAAAKDPRSRRGSSQRRRPRGPTAPNLRRAYAAFNGSELAQTSMAVSC